MYGLQMLSLRMARRVGGEVGQNEKRREYNRTGEERTVKENSILMSRNTQK